MHYVVPAIQHPFEVDQNHHFWALNQELKTGHTIMDGRNGQRKQ